MASAFKILAPPAEKILPRKNLARNGTWLGHSGSHIKNSRQFSYLNTAITSQVPDESCGNSYSVPSSLVGLGIARYSTSVKMRQRPVNIILASTQDMGIGFKGSMPWKLKSEMAYFLKMTKTTEDPSKKNAVIVGRKTWESIPAKFRPLKDRINIVLSSKELDLGPKRDDVLQCFTFEEAMDTINRKPLSEVIETTWIIGGGVVYKRALELNVCDRIYWTQILHDFECDTFVPEWSSNFVVCVDPRVPDEVQEENGVKFKYSVLELVRE